MFQRPRNGEWEGTLALQRFAKSGGTLAPSVFYSKILSNGCLAHGRNAK